MTKTLVLDSTVKSLQAVSSSTGTGINFVATWADNNGASFTEGSSLGLINGTTYTTVVSAPAENTRRVIKALNFYNNSFVTQAITLSYFLGGNPFILTKITLEAGKSWSLDDTVITTATATSTSGQGAAYKNIVVNGDFAVSQRTKSGTPLFTYKSDFAALQGAFTFDNWFTLSSVLPGVAAASSSTIRDLRNVVVTGVNVTRGAQPSTATGSAATSCVLQGFGMPASRLILGTNVVVPASFVNQTATISFDIKGTSSKFLNAKFWLIPKISLPSYKLDWVRTWGDFAGTAPDTVFNTNTTAYAPLNPVTSVTASSSIFNALTADTWETISLSFPLSTAGDYYLLIEAATNGQPLTSTDLLCVQNVQFELGGTQTAFEQITYNDQLTRCQNTLWVKQGLPGTGAEYCDAVWGNSTSVNQLAYGTINFPVPMRSAPSVTSSRGYIEPVTVILGTPITSTALTAITLFDPEGFLNSSKSLTPNPNLYFRVYTSPSLFEVILIANTLTDAYTVNSATGTINPNQGGTTRVSRNAFSTIPSSGTTAAASVLYGTVMQYFVPYNPVSSTLPSPADTSSNSYFTPAIFTSSTVSALRYFPAVPFFARFGGQVVQITGSETAITYRAFKDARSSTYALFQWQWILPVNPIETQFSLLGTDSFATLGRIQSLTFVTPTTRSVNVTLLSTAFNVNSKAPRSATKIRDAGFGYSYIIATCES